MPSLPKLPRLPAINKRIARNKSKKRVQVDLPGEPKKQRPDRPPLKFRDRERTQLAEAKFKSALAEEVGITKEQLEERAAEVRPVLDVLRRAVGEGYFEPLNIDEKLYIIEAHFEKNVSGKQIAKQLGRDTSTVTRFLRKYKSTVPLAKRLLEGSAEKLAERVIAKANVTEALEVLDRVDALPKKNRDTKSNDGPRFNVFVSMPGQQGAVPPVPDQKAIEAAVEVVEE